MNKDAHNISSKLPYWATRTFFCNACQREHGKGVFMNKTLSGELLCDRKYYKKQQGLMK